MAVREDPPTWDPAGSHVDPLITTKTLNFNKLFNLGDYPPVKQCAEGLSPVLVDKWRWVDDMTVEMTLKQGIKFHNKAPVNGRELVADDIVFSMERYKLLPFMAGVSARVKSTEAVDKYTFRMKTDAPWGGLVLELMGHDYGFFVMAKEAGGPKQDLWTTPEKSWIGTGPFAFERWVPGVKWSLKRNPAYWQQGLPYLDGVDIVVMPDVTTRMAALRSGQLDLHDRTRPLQLRELETTAPQIQILPCAATSSFPGMFYANTSGPPFNDVRVRRAVSMAIDRKAIVDVAYLGQAVVAGFIRPGLSYALKVEEFPPEVRKYLEYNPEEAKKLLAEAGYSKGFKTVFNVTPRYEAPYMMVAEMLAQMLGKVGITVELKPTDYGLFTRTVLAADYPVGELAMAPSLAMTPEDGHALRGPSKYGGSTNRSMVKDPEYDKLFDEFSSAKDEARRTELGRQLQIRGADMAWRWTLPYPTEALVANPKLRNIVNRAGFRDFGPIIQQVWFAP